MRSSSNTDTIVISKQAHLWKAEVWMPWSCFYCEMHCKGTVCTAAHNNQLSVCFSHLSILSVLLPHAWYMKDFSGLPPPPTPPCHSEISSCSCYFVFISFSFFHVVATLSFSTNFLSQRQQHFPNETSSLPLPLHILLSVFVSDTQSMSPFGCLSSHFSVFFFLFFCGSGRVNGACQCD